MPVNFRQCPDCGSKNTVKIVYGNPSRAVYAKAEAGLIRLGEGSAGPDSPEFFCSDCEYEWNREQADDAAYSCIERLTASVGRSSGGNYHVEVDFVHPSFTWRHEEEGVEREMLHKSIREITSSQFADRLKMVHLLDWDTTYTVPGVSEGTTWDLEIITGDKTIVKSGCNLFPGEWELFCREVQLLADRNFV